MVTHLHRMKVTLQGWTIVTHQYRAMVTYQDREKVTN